MTGTYDAFISYSHEQDRALAPAIRSGLERLARPWTRRRALRVFQDASGLAATPGLQDTLVKTLDGSRFLILLASPRAAESTWVNKEVSHFATRSPQSILLALTDGDCEWNDTQGDFDWTRTTAVPPALRNVFVEEPLWVDLRWAREVSSLGLRDPRFREAIANLAAPIHGIARDDLDALDLHEHRKARRARRAAIVGLATLTATSTLGALVAVDQSRAAREQRLEAQDQRDQALSASRRSDAQRLAVVSSSLASESTDTALLLALHSQARATTDEGLLALGQAITQPAAAMGLLPGSAGGGQALAGTLDGTLMAWTTRHGEVAIFETSGQETRMTLRPLVPTGGLGIRELSLAPDGSAVAATLGGGEVWIADLRDQGAQFSVLQNGIVEAAFGSRSDQLALLHTSGVLQVLDAGEVRWEAPTLAAPVTAVAWSDTDDRLAVASSTEIGVYDATTGAELARWASPTPSLDLAFNVDGDYLAAGGEDGTVRVWTTSGEPERDFRGHGGPVRRVAWGLDDQTLASSSIDTSVRIWDFDSGKTVGELRGHVWGVSGLLFGADGHTLYSSATSSGVKRWELDVGRPLNRIYFRFESPVTSVSIADDSSVFVTANSEGIYVWDRVSPEPLVTLDDALPFDVDLRGDGERLAVVGFTGDLTVYDTSDGSIVSGPREVLDGAVPWSVNFSADGSLLVVGNDEGEVAVLDADTGRERWRVDAVSHAAVFDVEFALDGSFVVAASNEGAVRWYSTVDGEQLGEWTWAESAPGHPFEGGRTQAAISPDGTLIAAGTAEGEVVLVDRATGDPRLRFFAHQNQIYELAFSPDGLLLATGAFNGGGISSDGFDGGLRLWNSSTGAQVANLVYHDRQVEDVTFSADGRWLLSAGADGDVLLWAGPAQWPNLACEVAARELSEAERARYLSPDDPNTDVCST